MARLQEIFLLPRARLRKIGSNPILRRRALIAGVGSCKVAINGDFTGWNTLDIIINGNVTGLHSSNF